MDLQLPMGVNLLNSSLLVKKTQGLYRSRRGKEVLFIEKESASHIVLSGAKLEFFNNIRRPMTVGEVKALPPSGLSSSEKEELLRSLYERNMVFHQRFLFFTTRQQCGSCLSVTRGSCVSISPTHVIFRCKYCYARAEEDHGQMSHMPREIIDLAVKKILEENPQGKMLIDFHGGEPFVAYDDMVLRD